MSLSNNQRWAFKRSKRAMCFPITTGGITLFHPASSLFSDLKSFLERQMLYRISGFEPGYTLCTEQGMFSIELHPFR